MSLAREIREGPERCTLAREGTLEVSEGEGGDDEPLSTLHRRDVVLASIMANLKISLESTEARVCLFGKVPDAALLVPPERTE
jgi:hypothetical protein